MGISSEVKLIRRANELTKAKLTPLTQAEAMMMKAIENGVPVRRAEVAYRASVADARAKMKSAGVISRQMLNQMLLDAYDESQSSSEKVSVVRELGKMNGLYAPEKSVSLSGKLTPSNLATLSDTELLRIASGEILDGEYEEIDDNPDEHTENC